MIHFNTSCREFAFLSSPMPFGKKSQEDCNYDLTHRLTAFLPSPVPFGKNYLVNPISNPSATAPVPVIANAFRQEARSGAAPISQPHSLFLLSPVPFGKEHKRIMSDRLPTKFLSSLQCLSAKITSGRSIHIHPGVDRSCHHQCLSAGITAFL